MSMLQGLLNAFAVTVDRVIHLLGGYGLSPVEQLSDSTLTAAQTHRTPTV